jgi:hypothetical protein
MMRKTPITKTISFDENLKLNLIDKTIMARMEYIKNSPNRPRMIDWIRKADSDKNNACFLKGREEK